MKTIKLHQLLDITSKILIFLLLLNLALGCKFAISCGSYIPTVFYLATIRGYDTLTVLVFCVQAFAVLILFIAFHLQVGDWMTEDDKAFMKLQELGIFGLIIGVGIVDESGAIPMRPVDDVHRFISFGLCLLSISWTYWALSFIKSLDDFKMSKKYIFAQIAFKTFVFLFLFSTSQWIFAYSVYHNVLFNHILESISEWSLVSLGLRLPYYISKLINLDISILAFRKLKY